jgi:hypothetical protein
MNSKFTTNREGNTMANQAKSDRRKKLINHKASAKAHRADNPGFKSNYATKHAYLLAQRRKGNSGFGFDYPDAPWK